MFYVVNKRSPSPETVYVAGGTKKELEALLGYKVISRQDCYNWIFLIKRQDLCKVIPPKQVYL
jgi:hypothetical protein